MPTPESRVELAAIAKEIFELNLVGSGPRSKKASQLKYDLTAMEFRALDAVARTESPTVGDIQKQLGILPAQMSRIMRSLETKDEKPYINSSINPNDRRKVDVSLTDIGRKAHAAWQDARLSSIIEVLTQLTEEERNDFMRIMRRMRGIILAQISENQQ